MLLKEQKRTSLSSCDQQHICCCIYHDQSHSCNVLHVHTQWIISSLSYYIIRISLCFNLTSVVFFSFSLSLSIIAVATKQILIQSLDLIWYTHKLNAEMCWIFVRCLTTNFSEKRQTWQKYRNFARMQWENIDKNWYLSQLLKSTKKIISKPQNHWKRTSSIHDFFPFDFSCSLYLLSLHCIFYWNSPHLTFSDSFIAYETYTDWYISEHSDKHTLDKNITHLSESNMSWKRKENGSFIWKTFDFFFRFFVSRFNLFIPDVHVWILFYILWLFENQTFSFSLTHTHPY